MFWVKTDKETYEKLKVALKNDERTKEYELVFEEMDGLEYSFIFDIDDYELEPYYGGDYNLETKKYNVFIVEYPNGHNQYINTDKLLMCSGKATNFEEFVDRFINEIENLK